MTWGNSWETRYCIYCTRNEQALECSAYNAVYVTSFLIFRSVWMYIPVPVWDCFLLNFFSNSSKLFLSLFGKISGHPPCGQWVLWQPAAQVRVRITSCLKQWSLSDIPHNLKPDIGSTSKQKSTPSKVVMNRCFSYCIEADVRSSCKCQKLQLLKWALEAASKSESVSSDLYLKKL